MPLSTVESKSAVLLSALRDYLLSNQHQTACWYAFNLQPDGPYSSHSLSRLLAMKEDEYYSLLLALGFRKVVKTGEVFDRKKIIAFCEPFRQSAKADYNEYRPPLESNVNGVFFLVGKFQKDMDEFFPKEQLKRHNVPPRLLNNALNSFLKVWRVYKGEEFDIVTPNEKVQSNKTRSGTSYQSKNINNSTNVTPDKDDGTYKNGIATTMTTYDVSQVLNIISLNLFNKICDPSVLEAIDANHLFSKALSLEDVMDCLATTMMDVQNQEAERLRKKAEAFQYATNPRVLCLNPINYPFLSSKEIDVTCSQEVESMLRDVSRMKKDDDDILKFPQYNNKPTTLVRVPYSSNTTMFHKNLHRIKGKNNFVDDVLNAMLPPKVSVPATSHEDAQGGGPDNDARWSGVEHAAEALIVHLGKKYGAAFVSAGDKIGMPVMRERKKMSPATTAAMLDDSAMTQSSLAVLRKYHIKEYGWWFGAPSKQLSSLADDVVPPIVAVATVAEQDINFWWKNPKDVIMKKLKRIILTSKSLVWNNLDIVIGGDHGQGSFRMSAKIILRQNRKKVKKFEVSLGDIECPKDSYDVLKATISDPINDSLKEIIQYERDSDGKITKEGSYKCIKKVGLDGTPIIYYSFKHTLEENEELVVERPFRLFISGDLAFYSMALGMKGSETNACWLCLLKKVSEWEKEPFKKGQQRTMHWILSNYEEAARQQKRINGLIEKPLFDAVEVCRYIVPPLHTMLGIANTILTDFKSFVENSVEMAPMELREARVFNTKGELLWKEAKKSLADFDFVNGPKLASLHQNMMDGSEHLQYLLEFEEESEDIHETDQEVVAISLEIDDITTQRRVLIEALDAASKSWAEAKSALQKASFERDPSKKVTKKKIYYSKPIKARIERVLRKYGIDIAAYHGGDLVGNDCRRLMANAAMIFIDIGKLLEEVCREQGMTDEARSIVEDRCKGVANALVVFDCIFSIMNKQNEEVDLDEDHKELAKLVKTALTCWMNLKDVNYWGKRNIPPKVHAMVQHLVGQFKEYGGIGDFDESFVELSHQTGKRDMLRSKAMRDRERKYSCISRWDETRTNPLVMAIKEEMSKRKREYKDDSDRALKRQKASEERKESRKQWLDTMVMRDLAKESGKVLAMKEYDARIEREMEAAEARLEADLEVAGGEGAQDQDFIGASNV